MDKLIDRINLAVAEGASSEAKQSGADACRAILAALEAEPGQALVAPAAPRFNMLALDTTQILDIVIGRLRAAVPQGGQADPPREPSAFRVEFVPAIGAGATNGGEGEGS